MNWIYILRVGVVLGLLLCGKTIQAQNPNWVAPNGSDFTSTASSISTIFLNDIRSDNAEDRIAFFVGNELRGLSTPVDVGGGNYQHFTTLYSNIGFELMSIKIYHQGTDQVYDVATPIEFEAQEIYGTVDIPEILNIYNDNDAPIFLNNVPFLITIEGLPFDDVDMEDYLVQPDDQGVVWSYTSNPDLNVSFTGSVLHVAGAPGFTGFATLTVRATELPPTTFLKNFRANDVGNSRIVSQNFAEVNINYFVIESYGGPDWQNIPSQGIVIGGEFVPINLHDYEYQYGGPAIQYDYTPIIIEQDSASPKPTWVFNDYFATNMNIVARVDYTPKYQFNHQDDVLAVYVDDEIRGTATLDPASGLYFITVGGEATETDSVTIKFYSGAMKKEFELEGEFIYEAHKIHGSIASPYLLEMAPIVPMIVDVPIPGGQLVMPVDVVDTTYLGTEFFRFYAFDPDFPSYLIDSTETSFCIVSDSNELTMLYADMDGDGLGDPNSFIVSCSESPGYVTNGDDCDDTNPIDPSISITLQENSAGIANDGFVCPNDNVTLTASGGIEYVWSTGETSSQIIVAPSTASTYAVTATTGMNCKGVTTIDIDTEGTMVTTSANEGIGSLRSVIDCAAEGDTISYDQPSISHSMITAPILIDKDVYIQGQDELNRPEIRLDFDSMLYGFEVLILKKLNIEDLDLTLINVGSKPLFFGGGELSINGQTIIRD